MSPTIVLLVITAFFGGLLVLKYFVIARSQGYRKAFQEFIFSLLLIVLAYIVFNYLPGDWVSKLFAGLFAIGLSVCVLLIILHIWHQRTSGETLLNLGTRDKNGVSVFILLIMTPVVIGITIDDFTNSRFNLAEASEHAFMASGCMLLVMSGMSKIKLTEKGIFLAPELLRWDSILAYQWEEESTVLVLKINRFLPFRKLIRLPISASQRDAVQELLLRYVRGYTRDRLV